MLGFVVFSRSFSLILGLLCCCLLVAVLKVRVDVFCDGINPFLESGLTLDPTKFKFKKLGSLNIFSAIYLYKNLE